MSTTSAVRATMSPVVRGWRAYFAPVNRIAGTPAIFDPARDGHFDLSQPPAPWTSAGWIESFKRSQNTGFNAIRSGVKGAPAAQFRKQLDARVEFEFCQWGKLQMALAGGSEHMNVLAEKTSASIAPSGGEATTAVTVLSGSTATEIVIGSTAVGSFSPGDLVAVDVDYTGQTGYIGSGISATYVNSSAGLGSDFVRRLTFNVASVKQVTANSLVLAQPLMGGVPTATAKVQKVVAFADREGGRYIPEWSGLFVLEGESGGRICFYYPRLQPCAAGAETFSDIADELHAVRLHANFIALPFADVNDGEPVLCWRSYLPASGAAVY